jgi:DUF4097 and DUF4098 domain-containing protein YvlB
MSTVSGTLQFNGERVQKKFERGSGPFELDAETVSGDIAIEFTN